MKRTRTLGVLGVLLVAAAAVTYQYGLYVAREGYWHARRGWALANGQLVDLGGYRLYISCRGTGTPVMVMDAGFESSGKTWSAVTPAISAFTTVCVYDRHGVGLSDGLPPNTPIRTASDVVSDLRALLRAHGVPAPYVLVGHSVGGLHVRLYAARHPEDVAGVVLIDSSHEDRHQQYVQSLSAEQRAGYLRKQRGANLERLDLVESARQVRDARSLPAVPLLVLSAKGSSRHDALQTDLASLRPTARHLVVPQSGHYIQHDAPAVVIESLRQLVPWSGSRTGAVVKR